MRAVILASGFNVRMMEVTNGTSKAFLEIGDEMVIDKIVKSIPPGINVTVTTNHLFDWRFREWQDRRVGNRIKLFHEKAYMIHQSPGTVGSLEKYIDERRIREPLLVMAVDNYLPIEAGLAPFIDAFDGESTQIAVQSERNKLRLPHHGVARLHYDNVTDFVEKPREDPWPEESLPRWTGIMCYIFPKNILPVISNKHIMDRAPAGKMPRGGDFIAHLVASGHPVKAFRYHKNTPESWVRLTTPEDYLRISQGGVQ